MILAYVRQLWNPNYHVRGCAPELICVNAITVDS